MPKAVGAWAQLQGLLNASVWGYGACSECCARVAGRVGFETRCRVTHNSEALHMPCMNMLMTCWLAATATKLAQDLHPHSLAHVRAADLRIEAVTVLLDAAGALALASAQVSGAHDLCGEVAASKQHTGTHQLETVPVHAAMRIKPPILVAQQG
jgi:hypothetical protein